MNDQTYDRIYRHGVEHGYDIARGMLTEIMLELESSLDPAWAVLHGAQKRLLDRKAEEIRRVMGE